MSLFDKLLKKKGPAVPAELTTITRTEILEGFSIPGIIHNLHYHFTNLGVYSDGLISCWRMVDLAIFKSKLNQGWVVTSIPDGEAISILNLGRWKIEHGEWKHTKETLYEYVLSLVKQLNPGLENLCNYHGEDSKRAGNVYIAKHFIPDSKPYHLEDANALLPKRINGEKFHFFYRSEDTKTYLVELSLYKSGRIEITNLPAKQIFNFDDLGRLTENQTITTELKVGETVTILNLGSFKVVSGSGIDIRHKLDELRDKFQELNGSENSISKCARLFEEYKQNPTKALKAALKAAYEAIPEHRRIFVGTMDTKDFEVRQIIYGNVVKQEWRDEYGDEYPFDDMPKPVDEE